MLGIDSAWEPGYNGGVAGGAGQVARDTRHDNPLSKELKMFAKFANTASTAANTSTQIELTQTEAFLRAVVKEGYRLSYAALAQAAKDLGENTSDQKLGQRGSKLVKSLPVELQPHVCRKNGKYAKGVTWETTVPGDLTKRPVITEESVSGAVEIWLEADDEAETEE